MFKKLHMKEVIRVLSLMEKRTWAFLFSTILVCFILLAQQIILAFVNKEVINGVISGQKNMYDNAVILAAAVLFCICIIGPIMNYIYERILKQTVIAVKLNIFTVLEKLPMSYYENNHSGEIISLSTNDANAFEGSYRQINSVVSSVINGVGSAVAILIQDWRFIVLIIALGVTSARVNLLLADPIRKISDKIQISKSNLTQSLVDILAGARILRIFNIGNIIIEKYLNENSRLAEMSLDRVKKDSQLNSINYALSSLNLIGVLVIGSFMAASGTTDFGKVIAIISLQGGVTSMILNLGSNITRLQESLAGTSRVFEFLDLKIEPERFEIKGAMDTNSSIAFENVMFGYESEKNILDNLSITVPKGKTVALVGDSGGGKSTIIKLIMGFYIPQAGNITINSKPMEEYSLGELRSLMAYVPQNAYLFSGTIEENILYGKPNATREEVIAAAKAANAHDFIMEQTNGYNTVVGESGIGLSGGQKQRIAIARAILKDAPILLLDEATSALDSESEQQVQEALNILMKGRTTIVIAHRLSTIESSDIIYVIKNGKVVEKGTHYDLLEKNGAYKEFYILQKR